MPERRTKPAGRSCLKKKVKKKPCKKPVEKEEIAVVEEEENFLTIEEEEVTEDEDYELPCQEGESYKELATAGYALDFIPEKKKIRPPFFHPTAPKARYENMIPRNVTNDHQYEASIQKTVLDHMSALRVTSEPFCKRQPAIIATIGPSCMEVHEIEDLLHCGMNIARINMAYGDRCCQLMAIYNIKEAVKNYNNNIGLKIPVGLMMDLKGPEIRTGRICRAFACNPENLQILIEKGSIVKLTTEVTYVDKCTPNLIYIDFLPFPDYVRPGMIVYINDGGIKLLVKEIKEKLVVTLVEVGGYLGNYRPVHVPMVPMSGSAITNIDAEDIELAVEEDFDFIVLSKVQYPDAITKLKEKLMETLMISKKLREKPIMILAKISSFQAILNIDEIINAADGIMIQRGDLGLDLPPEKIYIAQKNIIGKCNAVNKPVICSTQLMKSMTTRPLPDWSHVFDIANCIEDGADGICLTEETAIGSYPAETVEQAHHILREAAAADARKYHYKEMMEKLKPPVEPVVAIGMAACIIAEKTRATSIIVLTNSGRSARVISWFRPRCVVLAITHFHRVARHLHMWRSIYPLIYTGPCINNNWFANLDYRFQYGITFGTEVGFIKSGDPLVLVSGYSKESVFTNCLRVVYASTKSGIFLQQPKTFYKNTDTQKTCPKTKKEPCD